MGRLKASPHITLMYDVRMAIILSANPAQKKYQKKDNLYYERILFGLKKKKKDLVKNIID
ncbi:MAG: hypothetical protein ACJAS4_004010 [Bacteriovoracaceae bacterium]